MIDSALLDRLQKADPATWKRFVDTEMFTYNEYDDYGKIEHYVYQEDVIDAAKDAWLQHVLQDAIRVRGWGRTQISHADYETGSRYVCQIRTSPTGGFYGIGDTDNEALLKAYLQAIECV